MGTTLSYLPLLYNNSGLTGGLLDIAQGRGAAGKILGGADAILALRAAERDQTKKIATTAKEPQVAREIAAFRAGVAKAKTPAELLANPAVMKVLLTANGLGDQIAYAALAKQALLSNLADSSSLANRLTDTRWKATAGTYEFARQGLAVISNPGVLNTLSNAYAEITWRKSLDATTPGLSDALNFRDRAGTITSAIQILGDPVLRRVVTTALGLPLEIALQSLPAQEKAINVRLDIKRLADPKFVETFAQRYLLAAADKATQSTASPDLITLAGRSAGLVI
jgi:hypothetical protein